MHTWSLALVSQTLSISLFLVVMFLSYIFCLNVRLRRPFGFLALLLRFLLGTDPSNHPNEAVLREIGLGFGRICRKLSFYSSA
jgi:hypothetical protein